MSKTNIAPKNTHKITQKSTSICDDTIFINNILKSLSDKNIFKYHDHKILLFQCGDDIWFRGSDITKMLQYKKLAKAIRTNVGKQDKKKLSDFNIKLNYHNYQPDTIFININGLKTLMGKSQKPMSIDFAKDLGLRVYQKLTRIEIDIVRELDIFFKQTNIRTVFQYIPKNTKYSIDYYLPDHKLAIEIDEDGHKNRDPNYEKTREKNLKKILGCKFIRCNPDDSEFSISKLLGQIASHLIL